MLLLAVAYGLLTGCTKPTPPPPLPTPSPTPTPTPVPTPTPIPSITRKPLSTARLFNSLGLETRVEAEPGDDLASQDRRDIDAYRVEVIVHARVSRASVTERDFLTNDPKLPGTFKDFPSLLAGAKVSPAYEKLYALKLAQIERDIGRLDVVLARHNFYDCETMLNLQSPSTGRRALLAVGDMDVNVDGSDGDRNVRVDGSSQFFLPQTSYRWLKQSDRVNPFLSTEQNRLVTLQTELADRATSPARKKNLDDEIDDTKRRIFDLKKWSFLISETDPFIVLPGFMMRDKDDPFAPAIGDYALVLYGGNAYPAVVGDAGPSLKFGEASLLLCRAVNAKLSAFAGAVNDLKVAYLVFPGTAEPENTPPNLEAWRARCEQFVGELGGLSSDIHHWPDLVKPWPTPTPVPTPEPSLEPTPEPSLEPSATPKPSPEASPA
jgi:hypothetical protein